MAAVGVGSARGRGGEVSNTIRAALERLLDAVDGPRYDAFERQAAIAAARAALEREKLARAVEAELRIQCRAGGLIL